MVMKDARDESVFDVRIVERNIREGRLSKEEWEQFLASLEDSASEAMETSTQMLAVAPSGAIKRTKS